MLDDRRREYNRRYNSSEKGKEAVRRYRATLKGKQTQRKIDYRRSHGASLEDYDRLFIQQRGLCAICQQPEMFIGRWGQVRRLCVDHDHLTGKVRGLLCNTCNKMIAGAKDNPLLLANAITYLDMSTAIPNGTSS